MGIGLIYQELFFRPGFQAGSGTRSSSIPVVVDEFVPSLKRFIFSIRVFEVNILNFGIDACTALHTLNVFIPFALICIDCHFSDDQIAEHSSIDIAASCSVLPVGLVFQ